MKAHRIAIANGRSGAILCSKWATRMAVGTTLSAPYSTLFQNLSNGLAITSNWADTPQPNGSLLQYLRRADEEP
jgi:hypothetical protein